MKLIELSQGKHTIVDDDDFDYLIQWKWYAQKHGKTFRAMRNKSRRAGGRGIIYMHRVILCCEDGQEVDHINMDGLDNRKENLRICSRSQNLANRAKTGGSSVFKGVTRSKRYADRPWLAQIQYEYKHKKLGYFETEEQAAIAYNDAALELFGEFARLNIVGRKV